MHLFFNLIRNLVSKFDYVISDYTREPVDFSPLLIFATYLLYAIFISLISYLLGKRLKDVFYPKKIIEFDFLVSTALGYIAISTGITLLGFFSLLKPAILCFYIFTIIFIAIYPFKKLCLNLGEFKKQLISCMILLKRNNLVFIGVFLFVLVASVNLINPETREDQYHVDFPRIYLREQTIMIPPSEDLHVSGSSMLAEMYYMPGIFLLSKETARYIHFLFYILCILSLVSFAKIENFAFAKFIPLVFVTTPEIIRETSSMYVDFQWIFLLILSILLLFANRKLTNKTVFLVGLFIGGMVATKLWTIILIPIIALFFIFLSKNAKIESRFKIIGIYALGVIFVSGIWFFRAYLSTGNPFFPAFQTFETLNGLKYTYNIQRYFTINTNFLNPLSSINVYSPFLFLGIALLFSKIKEAILTIKNYPIFQMTLIVSLIYLFINYPYGRYLLGVYVLLLFIASLGIYFALQQVSRIKYALYLLVFITFAYYFISSVFVLPYAFGLSDKNKYLSRVLTRDNSSYFDFDYKFDKFIQKNDIVAMYNFHGYYYADFNFMDVNSIFESNNKSMEKLREVGVTKLMIRGGDILWFCSKLSINDCKNYSLISSYLVYPYYYLYKIDL